MTANLICFERYFTLRYYDYSGDRSSFVGFFFFVHIECATCLVHESCVVFRHNAVCSNQAPLFLLDPRDPFIRSHSFKKHATRALPHYLVLLLSRLWNSGAVIKSVVMICTVGSGEGPTV